MWTSGYGFKPRRFATILTLAVVVVSSAFFFNDYFNDGLFTERHYCVGSSPAGQSWHGLALKYLYLGISHMTLLGSNDRVASYCSGPVTPILLSFASVAGYISLATLVSLFLRQMAQPEQ